MGAWSPLRQREVGTPSLDRPGTRELKEKAEGVCGGRGHHYDDKREVGTPSLPPSPNPCSQAEFVWGVGTTTDKRQVGLPPFPPSLDRPGTRELKEEAEGVCGGRGYHYDDKREVGTSSLPPSLPQPL